MKMSDLFNLDWLREHDKDWRFEAFQRAYTSRADSPAVARIKNGAPGPFDRVMDRLRLGYSALVTLPGNCMLPAARLVRENVGNAGEWEEHGQAEQGSGTSFTDVWNRTQTVFVRVFARLTKSQNRAPHVIVHNLDDLADPNGLVQVEAAMSAFGALREAARLGVVFGMADREAGRLPDRLHQIFPEKPVELEAIDEDRFLNLVPCSLGQWFAAGEDVNQAALELIATRLRYLDPIQAVRVMDDAGQKAGKWLKGAAANRILEELWHSTKALGYVVPTEVFEVNTNRGFDPATIRQLESLRDKFREVREMCLRAPSRAMTSAELRRKFEELETGVLLWGPPGTGKTHLARWLARELNLPLRAITAADVRASDFGLTEKLVRAIFREARRAAPCVLLFDEADDLFTGRNRLEGSVASVEKAIVTATLQELGGVFGRLSGVLVIMTTNIKEKMDEAMFSRLGQNSDNLLHVPYPALELIPIIVANLEKQLSLNLSGRMSVVARAESSSSGVSNCSKRSRSSFHASFQASKTCGNRNTRLA
jgi:hypothetical protein